MIDCEKCGVEIQAKTHKSPIWGVATYKFGKFESYYFCSEGHGNEWIEKHNEYKLVERISA